MTMPFYVPPEQLMKDRAEFARKGIARGRSIVAVQYADGILILGENPSGALQKISEIYDKVAFAGVGKYNEFEQLRIGGIRRADLTGFAYSREDVTAKSLANAYAQTLGHIFTQDVKPYEVEIMVVEVGDRPEDDRLFRITYDGTLYDDRRYSAIGGATEALVSHLAASYRDGAPLADAIAWAKAACTSVIDDNSPVAWEAAVVERTDRRRAFRRLDAATLG
ncbi:MAG: proteasome subunit alpha [Actinobacteria bacterium RBG_16_67_15]|nr:MAG: proteasome subunit alpha [Actinobacteria bacterium RBG_16_67_15]